jgi:hypothetical protein
VLRRVNQFLWSDTVPDAETGRSFGLYVGLLRERFCVSGALSPFIWENPKVVYRGAHVSIGILADYARRPDDLVRCQGFTSSSRDLGTALNFPGNVLIRVYLRHATGCDDPNPDPSRPSECQVCR